MEAILDFQKSDFKKLLFGMDNCSVGQKLHDACHQLHFTRTTVLKKIQISDFQLLQKRTSVEAEVLSKIELLSDLCTMSMS